MLHQNSASFHPPSPLCHEFLLRFHIRFLSSCPYSLDLTYCSTTQLTNSILLAFLCIFPFTYLPTYPIRLFSAELATCLHSLYDPFQYISQVVCTKRLVCIDHYKRLSWCAIKDNLNDIESARPTSY